jgi:hypothetical protein
MNCNKREKSSFSYSALKINNDMRYPKKWNEKKETSFDSLRQQILTDVSKDTS